MPRPSSPATALFLLIALCATAVQAEEATPAPLMLILDASGSMWGQIDGENKIVIARRVLGGLVDGLPDDSRVGLIAYGHRREGDCEDIETVTPLGPLSKSSLKATVEGLSPKGKTPITRSVEQAFDGLRAVEGGATVILVSDGLETCGGDPCAAVRAAREQGVDFILHVVGFDVDGEDVSQLECAAQAGGGLFLSADNADELGAALDAAVAMPADVPVGRLVVEAVADGELHDVAVAVTDSVSGKQVAGSRTYTTAGTNPRSIPLPDGRFDVKVTAVGLKGDVVRRFAIEIAGGSTVDKRLDFSTGEISIRVTKNGELSDAVYHVYTLGDRQLAAQGRTYTSPDSNPASVRITSGDYEVDVGSVEISGKPAKSLGRITVEPRGRVELEHGFESGTLRVGAVQGDALVDAVVHVVDAGSGRQTAQGRTYTSTSSNPKIFELEPGLYRVTVGALKPKGLGQRQLEVTVEAGETADLQADFDS
jgi:Ca-activated chloride channel family protein